MIVKKLMLTHYRNYAKIVFNFSEGINYVVGNNAQGKTNLLESIYYLSTTKSHRYVNDDSLIQEGFSFFKIEAEVLKKNRLSEMSVISSKQGKNLYLFKNPVKKVTEYVGYLNAILFSPDDMNLFAAQPKMRRRFIDLELGKLSKTYLMTLNEFNYLLKERNSLLKNGNIDIDYLSVLNEKMAEKQAIILKQRLSFMTDLFSLCNQFYEQFSQDGSQLSFDYHSFISLSDHMSEDIIKLYQANFEKDCIFKSTSSGIHRDDFVFLMNGVDANSMASQGQKRTILLSIKVGLVMMVEKLLNEPPILLLDDVFSELDEDRKRRLMELLPKHIQIFISTTHLNLENYQRDICTIEIENGLLKEGGHDNG